MQQLDVGERVLVAGRAGHGRPAFLVAHEAARARLAGVDDPLVLEPADARAPARDGVAHGLHAPASCSARSTLIALTARGTPA